MTLQISNYDYNATSYLQTPSILQTPSTCEINTNFSDFLTNDIGIGWDDQSGRAPDWLETLCPEVVDHFNRFPVFSNTPQFHGREVPVQSTNYAAQSVCTMKVTKLLAASVQSRIYLHAGSHLGAIIHGEPIPWDDDVDMWMDYDKKKVFLEACDRFGDKIPILTHPKRVELHCVVGHNAIKVWFQFEGLKKQTLDFLQWYSPFVDLFLFRIQSGQIQEWSPQGERKEATFTISEYFPTQPFYFGGTYFIGPQPRISEKRYTLQNCVLNPYNHRLEEYTYPVKNSCIDCGKLSKLFPFVYETDIIKVFGQANEQKLYPTVGTIVDPLTKTTIEQRNKWLNASSSEGQELTDQLPNLNTVEVDNTISPLEECAGNKLKVIEFNAERGKRWLEATALLKEADVILLNEMDIGMARSDQQHTTRLLAYHLGMNYAWGLEFVELTLGDKGDRDNIHSSEQNFHGLHGNAILSKCKISNTTIFRNKVGSYFSKKQNGVNANGLERRLGGRMIMLGRIMVNGTSVVVGSTHKLQGLQKTVKDYINTSSTVIAGDFEASFCQRVGLQVIVSHRGDNICSNVKVAEKEYTITPCVQQYGLNISLGDHALTGTVFELP
jgi:hypothetical protein